MERMRVIVLGALAAVACGEVHQTNADGNPSDGSGGDATRDACVPESDSAFCMRLGKDCDQLMGTDNCGQSRTASCGACRSAIACLANVCTTPVCSSFSYGPGQAFPSVNSTSVQDALAGVTPSGVTILYQRGQACGPTYRLFIADETPPTSRQYVSLELTGLGNLAVMRASTEEALNLSADGLTIIGVTSDGTGFTTSSRSARGQMDFGAASGTDFAAIRTASTAAVLSSPVLSSDGLAFYYQIYNDPTANGIYESVRASATVPFPAGTLMPAPVQQYQNPTGISSDRLALFLQNSSFAVFVLTRLSLSAPFANPNAPNPPPMVPGWRTRPLQTCVRLIGTSNPGCLNEDTFFFDRL